MQNKDLKKAINRLKLIKDKINPRTGEKFYGKVTFHFQNGIIGHETIEHVEKYDK
jgi:hypothetical protein